MKILDGKSLANEIKKEVKEKIDASGAGISLAVLQVGDNSASSTYVSNKEKACIYCGITPKIFKLKEDISTKELCWLIKELNLDSSISGILVQLPLPSHLDEYEILQTIDPSKDVDGFNEINIGKMYVGEKTFIPCTAKGIIRLLEANDVKIEGKNCVVVGRSNIVGKPVAMELLHNNGTVTICHSKTHKLIEVCRNADILICAIGKPKFFNKEYIKEGAVVIDVGIHRLEDGSLCGDVDFEDIKGIVSAASPVPGGVGPMTVAMLMENCIEANDELAAR